MFGYILNSKCATKEILYRLDRTSRTKSNQVTRFIQITFNAIK